MRPLNLELNACMGGMSEGFKRAGIHFDMAVDYDPNACESHERNIGLRPTQMDIRDLLRMARIGAFRPPIGLFVADPPCTPWSMAGNRNGLEDERDLLRETVELITILRPQAWLIGNVPGLDKADNWEKVVEPVIYEPMRRAGYCVDYASFNAADFGTPQCRVRPFWFGHPTGTPCVRWELPTHAKPPVLPGVGLKPWVSCGEALEGAFGPRGSWGKEVGRRVRLRRRAQNSPQHGSVTEKPARTVGTSNLSDGNVLMLNAKHPPSGLDNPAMTVCAKDRGGRREASPSFSRRPDRNRPMADPKEPHRTVSRVRDQAILADELAMPASNCHPPSRSGEPALGVPASMPTNGGRLLVDDLADNHGIVLSEAALVVIQGFPKDWHVAGDTKTARMSQIGQAMPPQLSEAVARSIVAWCEAAGVALTDEEAP